MKSIHPLMHSEEKQSDSPPFYIIFTMCLEGVKDLRGKNFIYLHFKPNFRWHSKCYYLLSMDTYYEPKYYESVLMDFMSIFYFET